LNARANGNNFSGGIRTQNARKLEFRIVLASSDQQIAVIERCRTDADQHLPGPRNWVRYLSEFEVPEAELIFQNECFHEAASVRVDEVQNMQLNSVFGKTILRELLEM
jgi:hypothetical protein